jgi:hypothetical protein
VSKKPKQFPPLAFRPKAALRARQKHSFSPPSAQPLEGVERAAPFQAKTRSEKAFPQSTAQQAV